MTRRRGETATARALVRRTACAVCVGGLVLVAVRALGLAGGTPRSARVALPEPVALAPAPAPPPELCAPAEGRTAAPLAPAAAPAAPEPAPAADPEAALARCRSAVRGLAAALRAEGFDEGAWTTRVRAVADTLGPEEIPTVHRLLDVVELSRDERLGAATLLAALQSKAGERVPPLPDHVATALRAASGSAGRSPLVARLAARALAALGGPAESARLLAAARYGSPEATRRLALAALAASPDPNVALQLAADVAASTEAGPGADDPLAPLVAATLERQARDAAWAFGPGERALVVDSLAGAPADLVRGALVAWEPLHASELLALSGDPAEPALRLAAARDARDVESVLTEERGAGELAELVSRVPAPEELAPAFKAGLTDLLGTTLTEDADPAARRRAASGLARLGDPFAVAALARSALADEDASVRNAAVHALALLGGRGAGAARPELERALADPSPAVRRSAAHALGRDEGP